MNENQQEPPVVLTSLMVCSQINMYIWDPPLPSVCIHPPRSYISIKCMKGRGGRWSSPATERGVKKVYTLLCLIEWDMGGTSNYLSMSSRMANFQWHTWWLTLINIDSWSIFLGEPRHLTSFNQVCQSPGVFTNIPHVLMPPPSPRCRGFLLRHLKAGIKSGKLFGKCLPPKKR